MIAIAPSGFVILYGVRNNDPGLSIAAVLAYVALTTILCLLIADTHVAVKDGIITVHRFRTRRAEATNLSKLAVVPIIYPGLHSANGVPTAIAFDASGSVAIRVPMRGWASDEIDRFIAACHPGTVTRLNDPITPDDARRLWPSSYPRRSQWNGYIALAATVISLGGVAVLLLWAAISAR